MTNVIQSVEELDAVLHWRGKHTQAIRERDALQQRMTTADQRIDDLETQLSAAIPPAKPVLWGAPKTVRQLIQQLQTLDPELETHAMQRMPADFRDGRQVRSVPLSMSYERIEGPWLSSFKGDGRKVIAFWTKVDEREDDRSDAQAVTCTHLWTDNGEFEFACTVCGLSIDTTPSDDVIQEASQVAFEAGGTDDGGYVISGDEFDQIIANAASAAVFEYVLKTTTIKS